MDDGEIPSELNFFLAGDPGAPACVLGVILGTIVHDDDEHHRRRGGGGGRQ